MSETVMFEGVTWEQSHGPDIWNIVNGCGGVWLRWLSDESIWVPCWDGSSPASGRPDDAETTARELLAACAFARHLNEKEAGR